MLYKSFKLFRFRNKIYDGMALKYVIQKIGYNDVFCTYCTRILYNYY